MWEQLGRRQGKSMTFPTALDWSALAGTRMHCKEYESLSIEEKLLVDDDMKYLKDTWKDKLSFEIYRSMAEEVVIKLFKRGKKNGKRNGRQTDRRRNCK